MRERTMWQLMFGGVAAMLLWLFVSCSVAMYGDAGCLRHGYPQVSVSATGTIYCVKRVNQTDTVVALSKLR